MFKPHIIDNNKNHGKSEGIVYLKVLDDTIIEVSFICVAKLDNSDIVIHIFNKTTDVIFEI